MDLHQPQPTQERNRIGDDGSEPISMPEPWRLAAWLWSLLALIVGLALVAAVYQQQQQRHRAERALVAGELADKTYVALQNKLLSAESLLRSVQTLFLASDEVTRQEFANFYLNLHPRKQFPSLLALAYAKRETRAGKDHFMTYWVEPQAGNDAVVGLDVSAQPPNLAGLLASRDSDQATLSAPFRPMQQREPSRGNDGITLRLPVFSTGDPPQTTEQRRQRTLGSIAVSFRASRLVDSVLSADVSRQLRLQLSDITDPGAPLPLYDSLLGRAEISGGFHFERRLLYGGRVWDVVMQERAAGKSAIDWSESVLPAGVLASLMLAMLVYSIVSTRQRALKLGWQMSRRYRESEERFRALNELLPALVLLADVESGRITYANHAARDRLGDPLTARQLSDLFEDASLCQQLQHTDVGGCERIEVRLRGLVGASFWASVAILRIDLNGRGKLLMVASDTSEQRQLTELLCHQASHDALTDLFNRREFERRLHEALATVSAGAPAVTVLYVDLDQFKLINDTSGHLAGDQLLAQLSAVMSRQLGDIDVLARLGGDEFGVLLTGMSDRAEAERAAESLRRCIDGYVFIWEEHSYMISASIGGVISEGPGVLAKDLLSQADTACYMAKDAGRNRVCFYSASNDQTMRRRSEMEWANRLRWAVDEHRLELSYQEVWPLPLSAGEPAIEVLLRFREESGELLLPGVFLPAAERYGMMPLVDRWVIETTLANFDRLHVSGRLSDLVAINLSGASVEDEALTDWIIELLDRYQVEPSRVCFEITETVAIRNLAQVTPCMNRLRKAGCRIALDDFGAGMSSFTYLKHLPLDFIKIDGSFVRDMLTDPVSHLMVKAVTDIGHRLGLEVIAEWVADEQTVQALTELGVDWVQGFSLHRPEPALFHRG
ncbi:EAL domain-containing protein [Rhodanobacter sp. AS-Z3]|uniref:bifunctional diguanylate cyclase/phosphodiesterase n=1 Tax=Rhodanobacter sp. AS-Z3 TaxID=3031330 RepID=UPI002479800B|nr:EAL domain-containing protein [Rhodanobacter sp. AS-Z3]WEN15294.1 EAL domain-containing protein [Rhodanobacter sp. AS-Z3]